MAGIYATAGASVSIGQAVSPQSTDFVESDFDSQSWVDIGWPESLGAFGDEAAEVTFESIDNARTQKVKGNRNAGMMELVFAIDYQDDGQSSLRDAEATDDSYAFRVTFDDAPSGGTPSYRYFIALVMSARESLDTANNVMKLNASLSLNSNVVRVQASA